MHGIGEWASHRSTKTTQAVSSHPGARQCVPLPLCMSHVESINPRTIMRGLEELFTRGLCKGCLHLGLFIPPPFLRIFRAKKARSRETMARLDKHTAVEVLLALMETSCSLRDHPSS